MRNGKFAEEHFQEGTCADILFTVRETLEKDKKKKDLVQQLQYSQDDQCSLTAEDGDRRAASNCQASVIS